MLPSVAERGVVAIVLAAGSGSRLGSQEPKAFLSVGGVPMVTRAVRAASRVAGSIVVAVPPGTEQRALALLQDELPMHVVAGGASRQGSVRAALAGVPDGFDVVVVHDAARPFASPELFESVIEAVASGASGAIPVVAIADTVKRIRAGVVIATENRNELGLAQTPQAFRVAELRQAHDEAYAAGLDLTDDAAVMEWAGHRIAVIPGESTNVKVTTPADLERAEARE